MRLLHLSDTHLGAELSARGAPRGWSRAAEHLAAMEAALAPALCGEVDAVLHTGDVFDRSQPGHDAVAGAIILLHRVARRVPVVIMPGNHDRRGLMGNLVAGPNLHIFDRPGRVVLGGLAIGLVPYFSEASDWAVAAKEAVGPGVDLLAAHQSFDGARVPGFRFRAGQTGETVGASGLPKGVAYIAVGHIHTRQILRLGDTTIVHCGSTERTSHTEQDEPKGYTLWDFSGPPRWRFNEIEARPRRWITHPDQIPTLRPGVLTGLTRDLRTSALEDAVLATGAWLTGRPALARPPAPQRQGRLFGA